MIACFRSNISAKYYENPTMLSRVIAKNIGDVFLRHSVCVSTTRPTTHLHVEQQRWQLSVIPPRFVKDETRRCY